MEHFDKVTVSLNMKLETGIEIIFDWSKLSESHYFSVFFIVEIFGSSKDRA